MAIITKKLENKTLSAIDLTELGFITLPASTIVDLDPDLWVDAAESAELEALIDAGDVTVHDPNGELPTIASMKNWLGHFPYLLSSDIQNFTEEVQDAIGAAVTDTDSIDMTYDDGANQIKADLLFQDSTSIDLSVDASGLKAEAIFGTTTGTVAEGDHLHTFLSLTDTPSSYSGFGDYIVTVKAAEDGLEFTDPASLATDIGDQVSFGKNGSLAVGQFLRHAEIFSNVSPAPIRGAGDIRVAELVVKTAVSTDTVVAVEDQSGTELLTLTLLASGSPTKIAGTFSVAIGATDCLRARNKSGESLAYPNLTVWYKGDVV